jgi:hypothetical protein
MKRPVTDPANFTRIKRPERTDTLAAFARWGAWQKCWYYERTGDPEYALLWLEMLTRAGVRLTLGEQTELLGALRSTPRKGGRPRDHVIRDGRIIWMVSTIRHVEPERTLESIFHHLAKLNGGERYGVTYAAVKDVWHEEQRRRKGVSPAPGPRKPRPSLKTRLVKLLK